MSGGTPVGGGPEPAGRSRRGPSWAQLGRRTAEPAQSAERPAATALRPVPVRTAEPVDEHHLGDRLSAYLDGELGHEPRERVQAHLATCPDCLAEADEARAVKHLLTRTDTPGPSSTLMARLMAVAALPDDEQDGGPGSGAVPPGAGTLGGSRLTGGSFGRGAGSSFGSGALGADTPIPGVDPRAGRPGPMFPADRPFPAERPYAAGGHGLTSGQPSALRSLTELRSRRAPMPTGRPAAEPAAAAAGTGRAAAPFGRRFVFAAAGAFSVAAVTLGGVGGSAVLGGEEPGHRVTPVSGPGAGAGPRDAPRPADFPMVPALAPHVPAAAVQPTGAGTGGAAIPHHQLR
ncbi:zf-HC2 domain-containing protein [Kitasatospora sp. NPDC059571]|uniref:zf-HC2 domain-containing protein n=1 Tax=Kitasatospora sp. NPDC059571 TaxID=3346871 RepID=UPI003677BC5A